MTIIRLLFGALLLAAPLASWAGVNETIDYHYYEIEDPALTELSLAESLDKASPVEHESRTLHGFNRWSIRWQVWTQPTDSGCAIKDVKVDLDSLMQLPELVSESAEVQQAFNDYVEVLQRHLIGHYVVAIQAANKIDIRLLKLEPMESCEALTRHADEIAEAIVAEHREKEAAFDKMTDYGAEQGVSLPRE